MKKSDFLHFWHNFLITRESEIRFLIGDTKYYVVSYYETLDGFYVVAVDDNDRTRHVDVNFIKHIRLEDEQDD